LTPFLSIVIPCFNEETRLPRALGQVFEFLEAQPYTSEVLVVDSGSTDRTLAVAQDHALRYPALRILAEAQNGKGRAVRRGMLEAAGEYRFFVDADLSMPLEQVNRFLPPATSGDIAIASREAPGAVRYGEPYFRHLTGRVFNFVIRSLVLPGLQDTQCGFKCFSAPAAQAVFPRQTLMGWSFDVELLAIARQCGFSIQEIGIPYYFDSGSKIRVFRHSWRMFLDLLTVRRNRRRGLYGP
jgi:dolichyl-phosphate beta-glucosyltransferase